MGVNEALLVEPRAIAIGELFVLVLAEEARQRVPDMRERAVLGQVARATPARAIGAIGLLEHVIVHMMAPDGARQLSQVHRTLPQR